MLFDSFMRMQPQQWHCDTWCHYVPADVQRNTWHLCYGCLKDGEGNHGQVEVKKEEDEPAIVAMVSYTMCKLNMGYIDPMFDT